MTAELGTTLLGIARATIADALGSTARADESAPRLHAPGASFVTLTQQGELRGCIGTLEAHRSLLADVKANALAAAFRDPRFAPLQHAELEITEVEVSLLSPMQPMLSPARRTRWRSCGPASMAWCSNTAITAAPSCPRCGSNCPSRDRIHGPLETQGRSASGFLGGGGPPVVLYRKQMEGKRFATMSTPMTTESGYPARYWHLIDDGRMQCDLCPRDCKLHDGQRGACFVRMREGDADDSHHLRPLVGLLHRPDREKAAQPLLPGQQRAVVRHRRLQPGVQVLPELGHQQIEGHGQPDGSGLARSHRRREAEKYGCKSVAFTYNDPVIFAEYAMDVADACHARGIQTVAVTAGYMHDQARRDFYAKMDAANVDLKAFTEDFYFKLTGSHLQPVLDTLVYLKHRNRCVVRDHHAADPRQERLG